MNTFIEIVYFENRTNKQIKMIVNKYNILTVKEEIEEDGKSYAKIELVDGTVLETTQDYYYLKNEL